MSDSRSSTSLSTTTMALMNTASIPQTFFLMPFDPGAADRLRADADAVRYVADKCPGYPCRQCLRDADVGDELVLVSHDPFDVDSPYRSASPIFLHSEPCAERRDLSPVPDQLTRRQLSVRAFDRSEMMVDAAVIDGTALQSTIDRFFSTASVDHVDVHNATRGCWAARAARV